MGTSKFVLSWAQLFRSVQIHVMFWRSGLWVRSCCVVVAQNMDKLPVQTGENEEQANKIAELVYVFSEIHTYSFTLCVLAGQFFTEQGEEL